jgi:hypothetical protein
MSLIFEALDDDVDASGVAVMEMLFCSCFDFL